MHRNINYQWLLHEKIKEYTHLLTFLVIIKHVSIKFITKKQTLVNIADNACHYVSLLFIIKTITRFMKPQTHFRCSLSTDQENAVSSWTSVWPWTSRCGCALSSEAQLKGRWSEAEGGGVHFRRRRWSAAPCLALNVEEVFKGKDIMLEEVDLITRQR